MNHISPFPVPPRVPPVEPDLLASAIFLFGEYLADLGNDAIPADDEAGEEDEGIEIDTRHVLDLFAQDLGTSVQVTLNLYMRVTALYRMLAASPSLARMAMEHEELGGALSEDALVAAARLDLHVSRSGEDGTADFDPREFRHALEKD
jgi:hypothetical protein